MIKKILMASLVLIAIASSGCIEETKQKYLGGGDIQIGIVTPTSTIPAIAETASPNPNVNPSKSNTNPNVNPSKSDANSANPISTSASTNPNTGNTASQPVKSNITLLDNIVSAYNSGISTEKLVLDTSKVGTNGTCNLTSNDYSATYNNGDTIQIVIVCNKVVGALYKGKASYGLELNNGTKYFGPSGAINLGITKPNPSYTENDVSIEYKRFVKTAVSVANDAMKRYKDGKLKAT